MFSSLYIVWFFCRFTSNNNELEDKIPLSECKVTRELKALMKRGFHADFSDYPEDFQEKMERLRYAIEIFVAMLCVHTY